MSAPSVSIVVASSGRPRALVRCMRALLQIDYGSCEVVVVADAAGAEALGSGDLPAWVRLVDNPGKGVGAARNVGIAAAAGEIVVFIDDDAVAEPLWLRHLAGVFNDGSVAAATGYVLGRNGISLQWAARAVDRTGALRQLDVLGDAPVVPETRAGEAVMLEGTNMAIRREILVQLGGFDSAFRFLFDDADLAIRLSEAGSRTAVVPLAQVHHAFAGSPRRTADRVPKDLTDIGRSTAIFLRKHLGGEAPESRLIDRRAEERRRLVRAAVDGRLMPGMVSRLLDTFDAGVCAGLSAGWGCHAAFDGHAPGSALGGMSGAERIVLAGRPWESRRLMRRAEEAARQGAVPTVFVFSPTTAYHRVRYSETGVWVQTGGQFGRSERGGPLFQARTLAGRVQGEIARVAKVRGMKETDAT